MSRSHAIRLGSVIVVLIAVGAAAMTGATSWSETGTPPASPVGSPSPVASPRPVSLAGHGSAAITGPVTIKLTNEGFVPNYVQSTSGHDVTITLVNTDTRVHGFTIKEFDIDVTLKPGETKTVVVHPAGEGDFDYVSNAPGDDGMKGVLTLYI